MPISRSAKKSVALGLAGAAVAAATVTGTGAHSGGLGGEPASASSANQGNPRAMPPILRPATRSELAVIRSAEMRELARFRYHVPATARYSTAVFNGYTNRGK
jgi:hypothetical protein